MPFRWSAKRSRPDHYRYRHCRLPTYRPQVQRWSTIRVGGRTSRCQSRLIGHEVEARERPDVIEVRYRGSHRSHATDTRRSRNPDRLPARDLVAGTKPVPSPATGCRELSPELVFARAYDALRPTGATEADVS